ncbi:MAG: M48 family metalloprotease [Steroidobacteraceae bacterium]
MLRRLIMVAQGVASMLFRSFAAVFATAVLSGVLFTACATNPASGDRNVVLSSQKGEQESSRRYYDQIVRYYGIYEDQAIQDYVNAVGQRVARHSDLPDLEWHFTVLDDESINAFTTGGGYVYINRGLLNYLNTEAELAGVLGHEMGHVTARHPARGQTRSVLASILAIGAAIATGSGAVADLANIGGAAFVQGYGREAEMEADRLGLKYAVATGYDPNAMGAVFKVFKAQERFEIDAARAEGREPRVYHGVFSSHPAPDAREVQAAKGAAKITGDPPGGWIENRNTFLQAIDGLPFGTSRAQGIVRDNRFYSADMGITMAFPRGWTIENQRERILAFTRNKDSIMQITIEAKPDRDDPRAFLLKKLKGQSFAGGEALSINGMEGYMLLTRSGSPLDQGVGPVRWGVVYRNKSAYVFGGASKSAINGKPEADGLIMSVMQTMRDLKPSEFPLTEPYRIKLIKATDSTKLEDYAEHVPLEKYRKEELELMNGLYPNKKPPAGQFIKVVE